MYRTYKFKLDGKKFTVTDEGYLICQGACARTGIQNYPGEKQDGGTLKEFRSDEEVFSKESLDTHKMIPITMYHPGEDVNSETFKDFTVGLTGSTPRKEGDHVVNDFKIMDKATVEDILERNKKGKSTEISMGYHCKVIDSPGSFNGDVYDAIQIDIRCNHAALCDQGTARAGGTAKLRLDNNNAELAIYLIDQKNKRQVQTIIVSKEIAKTSEAAKKIAKEFGEIKKVEEKENSFRFRQMEPERFEEKSFRTFQVPGKPGVSLVFGTPKERKDTMKSLKKDAINVGDFHMDAIDAEYEDSSESLVSRLINKLDEAVTSLKGLIKKSETVKTDHEVTLKEKTDEQDKIRAQADQLKADKEKIEQELKELSDVNSDRVQKMIKTKARLKTVADHFKVDVEDKSDKEIKVAVIKAVSPDCKLDEESDGYINGRFDLIAEKIDSDKNNEKEALDSLREFRKNSKNEKGDKKNARETFMINTRNAHITGTSFPTEQ
ncbi:DUF2213 domain-containing protein [Candidatus Pacearchaeota archaeon]|nr:DUF2213 domain-containing protein [Candidatus Pacearchaeota archaeon]